MRIANRLAVMSAALILLAVGLGGLGLARMQQLDDTAARIAARFAKVELAERGVQKINENARVALHLFVVGDPAEFERQVLEQRETSRQITELYRTVSEGLDSDEERLMFAAVEVARGRYIEARSSAEATLRGGRKDEAKAMFDGAVLPLLDDYIRTWDELVALEGRRVDDASRDAATLYGRSRRVMLALMAVAVAGGAVFAALMARRITGPLAAIASAARRLERGEPTRLAIEARDELGDLARAFNLMGDAVAFRQERLEREMSLARRIQTALLPEGVVVRGLDLAAGMQPASEVGGDYYDVLPRDGCCWLGIGDVAGHGLDAGLIMVMLQSTVSALVRAEPDATPRSLVSTLNGVLYDNIRQRMNQASHATLVVLRVSDDGDVVFAGAHEELLVFRHGVARCDTIETVGTWVGGAPNIDAVTVDSTLHLEVGDVLVVFTDGVTEASNADGAMFGVERLCREFEQVGARPAVEIRDHLFAAVRSWAPTVGDDRTLMVVRRVPR